MNSNKKAIGISLIVGLLLMLIKFAAYYLTGSKAILTDALESVVNVAASAFAFYSIHLSSQPKDRNHPYGYGKVEFFSSGLEGTLILLAGLLMIGPAIYSFFVPVRVNHVIEGIGLVAATMVINASVGLYLINTGKRNDSVALQADGKHLMLDSLSSVILIIGLFWVKWTRVSYIDGILALILATLIIYNGYHLVKKSISGLMDELDEKTFTKLLEILNKNREDTWIDVHNLRIQKYGPDIHVDCHLTLPYYLSLEKAHDEVNRFEKMIQSNYPFEVETFIHTDPCIPQCCHYCQIENCSVRKSPFTGKKVWTKERILLNAKHFEY